MAVHSRERGTLLLKTWNLYFRENEKICKDAVAIKNHNIDSMKIRARGIREEFE